ncbi:MAG: glycosyltransferase, partial [Candidatus Theseobacter exili]|nr:glycosyltransferase [Candidatus Theseobacter exili]
GGIIWSDGSGCNYGNGEIPDKPEFSFTRDVDYCSGASIMLTRKLWEKLHGFDPIFSPGYYEDTDLAFRVRQSGYRVVYQPFSRVIHFEGITSSRDLNNGMKRYQTVNRPKFVSRWKHILSSYSKPNLKPTCFENQQPKWKILMIDYRTPMPDHDGGSADVYDYMHILSKMGVHITFLPTNYMMYFGRYSESIQKMGIECIYLPYCISATEYIEKTGYRFDAVILYRAEIAKDYIDTVLQYAPQAKVVFDTVDLTFLRMQRKAEITGSKLLLKKANEIKKYELELMQKANKTILLSQYEKQLIKEIDPEISTAVVPVCKKISEYRSEYHNRSDIVFVGFFYHHPNVDAICYFANQIWPLIEAKLPGCKLLVVGSNAPKEVRSLQCDNIIIKGHVPNLDSIFHHCRLSIAPLRYGAGIKGKVITSLSYGVPCVSTSIGIEGTGLVHDKHLLVADNPTDMAEAITSIYNNKKQWENLSTNGLAFAKENFSRNTVKKKLIKLFDNLELNL